MALSFHSAHGSGNNSSSFGAATKGKAPSTPLEGVSMTVHKNQICELHMPFNTPRAGAIRHWTATYCTNPATNVRLWVWRKNINWTTVALDSTNEMPKLTGTPAEIVLVTRREMNRCPEVSEFKVFDWNKNVITDDGTMEYMDFDPLVPVNEPAPSPVTTTTNPPVAPPGIQDVKITIDEMRTHVDALTVNFSRDLVQLEAKLTTKNEQALNDKLAMMKREIGMDLNNLAVDLKASHDNLANLIGKLATRESTGNDDDDTLGAHSPAAAGSSADQPAKTSAIADPTTGRAKKSMRK